MAITPQQIDEVAVKNEWFRPEFDQPPFTLVLQNLAGDLSLEDTAKQLTDPINLSYSTANSGNAIREAEATAASQRDFFTSEYAYAEWGDPLPEDEMPPAAPEGTSSTEGQLWELWFAVLHAAKRTPWQSDGHRKLVALVAAIQRVPDPPLPVNVTKALRRNWIWRSGTLWSTLSMMGPSSRETWNNAPGVQFEVSEAAIAAWENVNAFAALMTTEAVHDYSLYAIWGMQNLKEREEERNWLDATAPAAAAWIGLWGKELYVRCHWQDLTPKDLDFNDPATQLEWCPERWEFWKLRFQQIVGEEVNGETKAIAKAAFKRMEEIEKE